MAKQPKPYTRRQEQFATFGTRIVSRVNTWMYRRSQGRWGKTLVGAGGGPVCLPTTTGVKTGLPRTVAVVHLREGDDIVVIASKGGMPHNPQWYGNLVADPNVTIEIGAEKLAMTARTATAEEKARLWPRILDMNKGFAGYQARTEREIPVVICSPASG